MSTITGVVESKSRKGTGIKVNGNWYNGTYKMLESVKWKEEATIEVDADGKTIVSVVNNAPAATASSAGGKSSYRDNQPVIAFQAARNTAMTLLGIAVDSGALTLPSAKGDKLKALEAFVDEYTARYFEDSMRVHAGDNAEDVLFGGEGND